MIPDSLLTLIQRTVESAQQAQQLVEFIFICSVFLGGPLGIIYAVMEDKLLGWLKQEFYIKMLLMSIAGIICLGFAKITPYSDLTLFQIASAVPGVLGGISAGKSTKNFVADKVAARRTPDPGVPTDAGTTDKNNGAGSVG